MNAHLEMDKLILLEQWGYFFMHVFGLLMQQLF